MEVCFKTFISPLSPWNILMEVATISTLGNLQLLKEEHQLEERSVTFASRAVSHDDHAIDSDTSCVRVC